MDSVDVLKVEQRQNLLIRLKDNVVVSADREGIVFDLNTRKSLWINESAIFLLELLEENQGGVSLSDAEIAVRENFVSINGEDVSSIASFFRYLENLGFVSTIEASRKYKIKNSNGQARRRYFKPVIKEETESKHRQAEGGIADVYYGTN